MLDEELPEVLRATIVGLMRRDDTDLSARQLAVLLICYLEDGSHTVRGLAARLDVSGTAIARALDRLERLDLTSRLPDPGDRRSIVVGRTQGGLAHMAAVLTTMQAAAA
jgi:DNA-binding MarR family transcriptional regulator